MCKARSIFSLLAVFVARSRAFHAHHGATTSLASTTSGVKIPSFRRAIPGKRSRETRAHGQHHRTGDSPQSTTLLPPPTPPTPTPWEEGGGPTSRGRAIGLGLSAGWLGLTAVARPGRALDPIRKVQEQIRIRAQEEFDNVEALASPEAGKTIQPVLTLVPIVTLRLQLDAVEDDLRDPRRFGSALATLQAPGFSKREIKRVFNAYSDNIYYLPGSERENKYLQGGATPSNRQTLQYLLRNDVIDNVESLTAEIAYLIREREGGGAGAEGGSAAVDTDEKDLRMYLAKCKDGFDRYLGMVFQYEIDEATEMAKTALEKEKKQQLQQK